MKTKIYKRKKIYKNLKIACELSSRLQIVGDIVSHCPPLQINDLAMPPSSKMYPATQVYMAASPYRSLHTAGAELLMRGRSSNRHWICCSSPDATKQTQIYELSAHATTGSSMVTTKETFLISFSHLAY